MAAERDFRVKVFVEAAGGGPTREDVTRGFSVRARTLDRASMIARARLSDNRADVRGISHGPDGIVARVASAPLAASAKPAVMVANVVSRPRRK